MGSDPVRWVVASRHAGVSGPLGDAGWRGGRDISDARRRTRPTRAAGADRRLCADAYGANGDATAEAVAAGTGTPADFDRLAAGGLDLHGKIVLVRYPSRYSYRGFIVYLAQQRGAAAVLMYDDAPDAGIQRGGVGF